MLDGLFRQPVTQIGVQQQKTRDVVDAPDMFARLPVAEFDGCGQGHNHPFIQPDNFLCLQQQFRLLFCDFVAQYFS